MQLTAAHCPNEPNLDPRSLQLDRSPGQPHYACLSPLHQPFDSISVNVVEVYYMSPHNNPGRSSGSYLTEQTPRRRRRRQIRYYVYREQL